MPKKSALKLNGWKKKKKGVKTFQNIFKTQIPDVNFI